MSKKYIVWDGDKRPEVPQIREGEEGVDIFLNVPRDGNISVYGLIGSSTMTVWQHYEEIKEPQYRDMTPQEVFDIMAKGAVVRYHTGNNIGSGFMYNREESRYRLFETAFCELSNFKYSLPDDDFLVKWHEFKVEVE